MRKKGKIKAVDVRQYINGQPHKRLWTQAFSDTVIITGFCPFENKKGVFTYG